MAGLVSYGLGLYGTPVVYGLGGGRVEAPVVVGPYAIYCSRIVQKPWWQGDPAATKWQIVMGSALDDQADRLDQARAVRYPTTPRGKLYSCPTDALSYLADERGIERVPTESEADWRERMRRAWRIWHDSGTQQGIIDQFGWYGLTNVTVWRRYEWSTPPAAGSQYVQAFARLVWAQVDVLIQQPHPWKQKRWGDGSTWGEYTWGSTMRVEEVSYFRRQLQEFKGGHDTVTYLYLSFTQERLWGPQTKWGEGVWGSNGQVMPLVIGEEHWNRRGLM